MLGFTKKLHTEIKTLKELLQLRTQQHVASDIANEKKISLLQTELLRTKSQFEKSEEKIVSHRAVARAELLDAQNKLVEAEEKVQTLTNQLAVSERLREIKDEKKFKKFADHIRITPKVSSPDWGKPAKKSGDVVLLKVTPKKHSAKRQAYYDRGK